MVTKSKLGSPTWSEVFGNCPNVTSRIVGKDEDKMEFIYAKVPHKITGRGIVTCTQCSASWCCMECACQCDALDHTYFDMIYDHEGKTPPVYSIVCCKCSGNKPSWSDRDD